jgi:TetR/AcrR family transcriptional repressor of nem operon
MPRAKTFDEEVALRKAMELFWEKGYEATSLHDLTEKLGIGKGSFYATFKSKEGLFNQCIERYTELSLPVLSEALKSEPNFRTGLKKLLASYVEGLVSDSKRKGCFMANSCSLVHSGHPGVGKKIQAHYARIEEFLADAMKENGISATKAKSASAMIVTFLIGMSQQSKINQDKASYLATVEHMVGLLG